MNITTLAQEATHFDDAVPCPLYDAAGQPEVDSQGQPVTVSVISEYSAQAKRIAQTQKQLVTKLIRRYGSWDQVPQVEIEALDNRRIAGCLTGWSGFESTTESGAVVPLAFSTEAAVVVIDGLRKHRPAQLKQIEGAIAAHASFFTTASAT